jgi:redox-sensitive bicupin YhaK (pirin superfamily)
MGPIRLRQPIPTQAINSIDPFVLLHHYGPYKIDVENNPFDLGPHPHRGFGSITFLIQGEQLHRDSLGNESIVKAGDVQWTTSGRGIIHAEGPTKEFIEKGGALEGIQLWLNLPAAKKMMQPKYQHVSSENFNVISSEDGKVLVKVIAGNFNTIEGKITTQTPVNTYIIDMETSGVLSVPVDNLHHSMLYLLDGDVLVNQEIQLLKGKNQLLEFNTDGNQIIITANIKSKLLFLSGMPLNEKVVTYGPYVMTTQTELLEAMRDYQQGKMGFLPNR